MTHLQFLITPVAKGRPRFFKGVTVTPGKTRQFESTLSALARKQWKGKPLSGPLRVTAEFIVKKPKSGKFSYPAVRPDLDNYVKALFDSLNEIVWHDDAQVIELHAQKLYDLQGGSPRIEMQVEEVCLGPETR